MFAIKRIDLMGWIRWRYWGMGLVILLMILLLLVGLTTCFSSLRGLLKLLLLPVPYLLVRSLMALPHPLSVISQTGPKLNMVIIHPYIGQRTPWYILGLVLVVSCYIPIYQTFNSDNKNAEYAYYIVFPALFNVGWAALQISHMSLVPSLTCSRKRRVNNRNYLG